MPLFLQIGSISRMKSLNKYECSGQINLFDYIEPDHKSFCWDNDINEILESLQDLSNYYGLEIGKAEFRVWEHVPHLGYRLWVDVRGTRKELFREEFQRDITILIEEAKQKEVELTPMWGACMFFTKDENEKGRLSFSTLFLDKTRQRIKRK